jgi:hypothetical protein
VQHQINRCELREKSIDLLAWEDKQAWEVSGSFVLQHLIDSPWTVPNGVRKACELLDLCFFVGHRYYVEGELNTAERHLRRGMLNKILVCSLPEYSFIKNSKFVPNIAMFRVLNPLFAYVLTKIPLTQPASNLVNDAIFGTS